MSGLTQQQARAFGYIREFIADRGFAPSLAEIGSHIGVGKTAAHRVVNALEERGCVQRVPGKARAIEAVLPRTVELNPEIFALMVAYARTHSTSVKTATNEALRQWLGAVV